MTASLLFQILYWVWFASEVLIFFATRTSRSTGRVRDRGSIVMLWIAIAGGITACEWIRALTTAPFTGERQMWRLLALVLLALGLAVRWTAIATLGKAFSVNVAIHHDQQLKQDGVYRFVRHPSYSGLLLILLAVATRADNWIAFLALMAPCTAALLYRIQVEEAALSDAFGAQYAAYRQHTSRLIPGVY